MTWKTEVSRGADNLTVKPGELPPSACFAMRATRQLLSALMDRADEPIRFILNEMRLLQKVMKLKWLAFASLILAATGTTAAARINLPETSGA